MICLLQYGVPTDNWRTDNRFSFIARPKSLNLQVPSFVIKTLDPLMSL